MRLPRHGSGSFSSFQQETSTSISASTAAPPREAKQNETNKKFGSCVPSPHYSCGSTQICVGTFCSFLGQEGRENLESQILLIPITIDAPLNHADLVIQPFHKAELTLLRGSHVATMPITVLFDQDGETRRRSLGNNGTVFAELH